MKLFGGKKLKLPSTYYNYISYLGSIIALIAWITFVFLIIWTRLGQRENVYFDLYTYLVVPSFLVGGLLLIPIGMYFKRRKQRKGIQTDSKVYIVNLSEPKTRNAIVIFVSVTVVFILCTVVGSYQGFHYTESVEFCGKLCHKVMGPEYIAYQNSAHAKVKCAECHIGEGVNWYVKSKMSGMRQVYKYLAGTYPTPIETPIANLRPARETCEKCHWPQKFYTNNIRQEKYFLQDSANTEWNVILNMRVGADHPSFGLSEGIHWHINPDIKMEYKASHDHDTIFWVRTVNLKTGESVIYQSDDEFVKSQEFATTSTSFMDCMDCHNRPSHEFRSPSYYVNGLFASGKIPTTIPWLKKASMLALKPHYTTTDDAVAGISESIIKFYKDRYPASFKILEKPITAAIEQIIEAFSQNAFPEMKITYADYPRNIGHLESYGCFRCHDDRHKSTTSDDVIRKDCDLCHSIIGQGPGGNVVYNEITESAEFIHPIDIGDLWKKTYCKECHR